MSVNSTSLVLTPRSVAALLPIEYEDICQETDTDRALGVFFSRVYSLPVKLISCCPRPRGCKANTATVTVFFHRGLEV